MDKIELIKKAKNAYYNSGEPIMSDFEYDKLVAEVGYESVGAPVLDSLKKIDISDKPMLSLKKCHSSEEILDFAEGQDLVASVKCDGLSVRIVYENGKIVSANTRGDGRIGQDITEHIKQFTNVPLIIDTKERLIVDGEAVILQHDFDEINKNGEFKNPRNLAAGTLASLDTSLCRSRRLSFIAWDVIEGGDTYYYSDNLANLLSFNFTIAPYALVTDNTIYDDINEEIFNTAKKEGIPCDGVVWRFNDIAYGESLGRTAHHFNNGIAWKPAIEEYETRLKYIKWSMGRTGVLTPVAIFEPINIDGTEIERASLHNYSVMKDIMGDCCYCGQKIKVFKANMIIPQISWAYKMSYGDVISNGGVTCDGFSGDYGLLCPICEGSTSIVESESGVLNVICDNSQCDGKLINKLDHYCSKKGLDIKGLSKMTIEKLIDWGWLNNISDIYNLSEHKAEWIKKAGFGPKSVSNILEAIEKSKECELKNFISAIGIPLIGQTVAKEIIKYYSTWDEFRAAVGGSWSDFDGFGYEMEKAINNFDYTQADKIAEMLTFKEPVIQKVEEKAGVSEKIFAITGKLTLGSRAVVSDMIRNAGGHVSDHVTAKTDYLVCNKPENTSKYNNAVKFGTTIINEDKLKKMLGE